MILTGFSYFQKECGWSRSSSDIISKFEVFFETKKVLRHNECTSLNTTMKYDLDGDEVAEYLVQ